MSLCHVSPTGTISNSGLLASRDINPGECILDEVPLLVVNTQYQHQNWDRGAAEAFFADEHSGSTGHIHREIKTLTPNQRQQYRSLYTRATGRTRNTNPDVKICELNAFGFAHGKMEWLSVYHTLSRANHSCVPNACILEIASKGGESNGDQPPPFVRGQARLIATQYIPHGAEIFIDYIADMWLSTCAQRKKELRRHYHFTCHCAACGEAAVTNARRAVLAYQNEMIKKALPTAGQRIEVDQQIAEMQAYLYSLRSMGIGGVNVSEACTKLANLYLLKDDLPRALVMALGGSSVEALMFLPRERPKLERIVGECCRRIPRLWSLYNGASLTPFPW